VLRIFSESGTADIRLTVVADAIPVALQILAGAGQNTTMGNYFASPIRVRVTRDGAPVSGATVWIETQGPMLAFDRPGGFDLSRTSLVTGADGVATSLPFRSYSGIGVATATVRVFDVEAGDWVTSGGFRETVTNARGDLSFEVQDMWWGGPSQNGWGMSIAQHDERLFTVLFTYDDRGAPTWHMASGRWLATPGGIYTGQFFSPRGSPTTDAHSRWAPRGFP
jgi:hypothetical protein